jgi:signal transduction histidine kinase
MGNRPLAPLIAWRAHCNLWLWVAGQTKGEMIAASTSGRKGSANVWETEFLEELKRYVGFTDAHAQTLAALAPYVTNAFPGIVERFYEAIQQNPRALAVFKGGSAQIERQKSLLHAWLEGVVSGVYDVEYLKLRARIGRTHVRIQLDQRYVLGAMNIVREGLHDAVEASSFEVGRRPIAHRAIDKICDLELAIMLQTYSEDYTMRIRDSERLATLGQLAGFVGHELRNPLAVMETSLHLLKKRLPEGDSGVERHTRRLGEQLATCTSIISDLLDLARDKPLATEPVLLEPLVRAVIDELPLKEAASVSVEIADDLPEAQLDPKQLRHLIANLVTNAIQAVAEGPRGAVIVRATREGVDLLFAVDDDGPGVPEELKHRLFEPLATTRSRGLGLGLALCRRVAEKHGGDIRALRSALGGARFEVRFPHAFASAP